jgi:hypothetical protein
MELRPMLKPRTCSVKDTPRNARVDMTHLVDTKLCMLRVFFFAFLALFLRGYWDERLGWG